jgi:hypothetical protein
MAILIPRQPKSPPPKPALVALGLTSQLCAVMVVNSSASSIRARSSAERRAKYGYCEDCTPLIARRALGGTFSSSVTPQEPDKAFNPFSDLLRPRGRLIRSQIVATNRFDLSFRKASGPANLTPADNVVGPAVEIPVPHRGVQRRLIVGSRQLPFDIVQWGHHPLATSARAEMVGPRSLRIDIKRAALEVLGNRTTRHYERFAAPEGFIHDRAAWWRW